MSEPVVIPPGPMTREAFHAWAEDQPRGRFELCAGEVVAMAPGRLAHARAKAAAWLALRQAIAAAGLPCEALPDGVSVAVDDRTSYEPDALVSSGERASDDLLAAPEPVVVVEVTSPSNSRVDLTTKLADYFRVPSVRHYLILHLAKRVAIHHRRREDGSIETAILGAGPILLDPPGIRVRVEDLFPG